MYFKNHLEKLCKTFGIKSALCQTKINLIIAACGVEPNKRADVHHQLVERFFNQTKCRY
jgi:uncharacterized metal-binding protein